MTFDEISKSVIHRFETAIKDPSHVANIPPGDAILLASAMLCSALKDLEAAVLAAQQQPFPPESAPGEMFRGAAPMGSAPAVKVDVYPPGKEPPGAPPIVAPVGQ